MTLLPWLKIFKHLIRLFSLRLVTVLKYLAIKTILFQQIYIIIKYSDSSIQTKLTFLQY